jgi:hypothetical protein
MVVEWLCVKAECIVASHRNQHTLTSKSRQPQACPGSSNSRHSNVEKQASSCSTAAAHDVTRQRRGDCSKCITTRKDGKAATQRRWEESPTACLFDQQQPPNQQLAAHLSCCPHSFCHRFSLCVFVDIRTPPACCCYNVPPLECHWCVA